MINKYALAVAAVVVALILKLAIGRVVHIEAPFLLFFGAVIITTWFGGFGPGLVAAFLSAASATLFFTTGIFGANTAPVDLFQLVLFFVEALLIVGLSGSLRETRAQAETTESAKEEAYALLDTFQVYAPIGLAFLDNDLRYVRINYAMAELNGLTPAAHIGRTIQEVQPQISAELIDGIRDVIQTGKPLLDQELTVTKPTMLGVKKQHLLTSYYRIRSTDGKPLGVGAVMVDITPMRRAEEALRESEQRFRVMADTAPVMIWMSDTSKLCTYFNKVWLDFTGRTLEQEIGNGWLDVIHPDDVDGWLDAYRSAFDAREEFKREYRQRRHDGVYRWVTNRGIPRFTPEGAFAGYIGSCIDIDERKQIETNQQFLAQASIILASSIDYETTLTNVAQLAVPEIGDWCAVDLLTPENKVQRLAVTHVNPEKVKWAYELSQRYPVDLEKSEGVGKVIRTGESQFIPVIDDAMLEGAADTAEMYEILKAIGFSSAITVPLTARGRIFGALTLVSAESGRHYTERDLALAEELGTRAALAVDNARLYNEARTERERFHTTLASIGDAVIATDSDGHVTFVNHVAESLTGWAQDDAFGLPLDDIFKIVNEQSREVVESPVMKVLREGRVIGLANHTVLISKTGSETPIDDSGAPIPSTTGSIGGVVLVFRDVTERKRAEDRAKFLAEASNLLISSLDYETTLQHVTRLAVPTLADSCMVYLKEPSGAIRQVAMFTDNPETAAKREAMLEHYPPTVSASYGYPKVIATGKSELLTVTDDVLRAGARNEEHFDMLRELSYHTTISVPLKNADETFGALTLATHKDGRTLNSEDLAVTEELGRVASLAIDNARLYAKANTERERFLTTLASIGDAVIATDKSGRITFLNYVAETLTGWQHEDALGKPLDEVFKIVNEQSREPVESPVVKVLREGQVVSLANHSVLISKMGHDTPIDDSGAPIPNAEGGVDGVVLVFRDVTERKRLEERQKFLYDASNLLSSSLDYETTLQNVTRLAVPALADWCIIHLRDDSGEMRQVALYHADPERAALREDMMRRFPPIPSDIVSHTSALNSEKPGLLEEISDEVLQAAAINDEHLEMLRQLSYKSSLSVPLRNLQGVFGVFTLRTSQGGQRLTEDDLALAEELGHLVSLAIDNARLYRQAQNRKS